MADAKVTNKPASPKAKKKNEPTVETVKTQSDPKQSFTLTRR